MRASRVTPEHLLGQVWGWIKNKQLDKQKLKELRANSPLGEILAAGLANSKHGREIMKECIEEAAARVIHELERYINALGTIAAMAPLLGLLGTVLGMIDIFSSFMGSGMSTNAAVLAGGISKALITTAAGLMVGIPRCSSTVSCNAGSMSWWSAWSRKPSNWWKWCRAIVTWTWSGTKREISPQATGKC